MAFQTLISTADLELNMQAANWLVVDCRFNLADPAEGRRSYELKHIAGAVFADLDHDLSGTIHPGVTGRHPLPSVTAAAKTLSVLGVDSSIQVIAYDDRGGMTAGRLWWMLKWLGHEDVAVLDGGWPAWVNEGRSTTAGIESRQRRTFVPHVRPDLVAGVADVQQLRTDPRYRVIDSRTVDRYRGENETLDPVAGHIPGAIPGPFVDNLDANGRFLPATVLKARFESLLGEVPADRAVFYCGSGVSAAHNVLAVAHAGLGDARLYPGSWSEWITDPKRPVATGPEPGADER